MTPEEEEAQAIAELRASVLTKAERRSKRDQIKPLHNAVAGPRTFSPEAAAPRLEALVERDGVNPTAQALAAWENRIKGVPVVDIAHAMGLSIEACRKLIKEAHEAVRDDLKEALELNRTLDLERIDGLLKSYYPAAVGGCTDSAYITLAALKHRAKLTGAEPGSLDKAFGSAQPANVLVWIQNALPQINKIVEALPAE